MTVYRIVLIAHLFGLAFGMGGAGTIDAIFLVASRRGRVTRELIEVVHAAAGLVAGAMVLLAVSGVAFFAVGVDPTPKFWAKLAIVGIACLNGLAAHRLVFPRVEAAAASGHGRLRFRPWDARLAATSAAVSGVSWSGALVLGAWHGLKLGAAPILAVYTGVLGAAVLVSATLVAPRVFVIAPARRRRERVRSLQDLRQLPVEVAHALALAVADGALALAGRLGRTGGWQVTDGVEGFTAPAYATVSRAVPPDDPWGWPRRHGAWGRRGLPHGLFGVDDRGHRLDLPDLPGYGVDAESAIGGR